MQQIQTRPRILSTTRQRDLPGLMALYEENYIRLRQLLPRLDAIDGEAVSSVRGGVDLHVRVIERSRYTSTLHLSYRFGEGDNVRYEPDLRIRVQHDARTAEALDLQLTRGRYRFDARRTLQRSWQRNRFLHKWLGYCLYRGHRFPGRASGTR